MDRVQPSHAGTSSVDQRKEAPTWATSQAKKIVTQSLPAPQDFISTKAMKAKAAFEFHRSGVYHSPPSLLTASDIQLPPSIQPELLPEINRALTEFSEEAVHLHPERHKISLSSVELKNLGLFVPEENRLSPFQKLRKKLRQNPSPSEKQRFHLSPEKLREAAFGETDPNKAYAIVLGRIAAHPEEPVRQENTHLEEKKENDAVKSYEFLAKTALPGDPIQNLGDMRLAISNLRTTDAFIDGLSALDSALTPEAREHPMFLGIKEYQRVWVTSGFNTRRGLFKPTPPDRNMAYTCDSQVRQELKQQRIALPPISVEDSFRFIGMLPPPTSMR